MLFFIMILALFPGIGDLQGSKGDLQNLISKSIYTNSRFTAFMRPVLVIRRLLPSVERAEPNNEQPTNERRGTIADRRSSVADRRLSIAHRPWLDRRSLAAHARSPSANRRWPIADCVSSMADCDRRSATGCSVARLLVARYR